MKQGRNRLGLFAAGLLVPLMVGTGAYADDTELFVAAFDPAVTGSQPNVMFIMDTSGSMTNEVITQAAWNTATTFDGCFESGAYYFSTTGNKPPCGSNDYFWKDKNYCEASFGTLAGVGQYQDGFKAWRGNVDRWVNLNGNRKNRRHECSSDQGVHGEFSGGSDVYAVDGVTGPWDADANSKISYGTTYRTSHPTVLATVPVGYADGLSWQLSSRGQMLVGGVRVPIVGRVCMDMTVLDVGRVSDVGVGDEVVLIGHQGQAFVSVEEMASTRGTINYEVVTTITPRIPRIYSG